MRNLVLFFVAILIPLTLGSQTLPEGINLDYRVYTNYIQIFIGVLDGVADSVVVVCVEDEPHLNYVASSLREGVNNVVLYPQNPGQPSCLIRIHFYRNGANVGWKEFEITSNDFEPISGTPLKMQVSPENISIGTKVSVEIIYPNPSDKLRGYIWLNTGEKSDFVTVDPTIIKGVFVMTSELLQKSIIWQGQGGGKLYVGDMVFFGPFRDGMHSEKLLVNFIPTSGYGLAQNAPNPFNPETRISYSVAKAGHVKLAVYNVLGQKVADLVDEYKTANSYKVTLDASNLTSGVYFYRLEVGDFSKTMKMILQR